MASTAHRLAPLVEAVFGQDLPLRLRAWDGSEIGPADAPAIVLNRRRALRRIIWQPDELGLARAFVSGDLDVDGDLYDVLTRASVLSRRESAVPLTMRDKVHLVRAAAGLGVVGPPPSPPDEEARISGTLHSKARDKAAVRHHYDVGNDFYHLVLGDSMVYSCAYWARHGDLGYGLQDAQYDKCDLIARKLALEPGMRLLDVGCGWGTLAIRAARKYGVRVVGVTLSLEQAELARKRVAEAGLTDQVEIRVQDYREVSDGPYDAISSVGMAEHVGAEKYAEYAACLFGLLRPGGRLLNHQIARPPGATQQRVTFISAYVFPDGELLPLGTTVSVLEEAGFEVRDVESLREHYALTLRAWVTNLEQNWHGCVRHTSDARARVWQLYMAGSALSFEQGRIGVNQVLAVRRHDDGRSDLPLTRARLLGEV
ncbi:MAG: class I SAM-dependent methyltransferase [Actinomycetes bacterium]